MQKLRHRNSVHKLEELDQAGAGLTQSAWLQGPQRDHRILSTLCFNRWWIPEVNHSVFVELIPNSCFYSVNAEISDINFLSRNHSFQDMGLNSCPLGRRRNWWTSEAWTWRLCGVGMIAEERKELSGLQVSVVFHETGLWGLPLIFYQF